MEFRSASARRLCWARIASDLGRHCRDLVRLHAEDDHRGLLLLSQRLLLMRGTVSSVPSALMSRMP